ncbi:MAG TPA: hypothetical protein VEL74_14855 [Thermoanaerobaculia bacterium]|nr:hypothetical protein [Thermoanaerobaculia bacterium]
MKSSALAFVLFALVALVPCPQLLAAEDVSGFLATLPQTEAPTVDAPAIEGAPDPTFLQTIIYCNSHSECPAGKLCCYPCGIDGCQNRCLTPVKGRCPLFV